MRPKISRGALSAAANDADASTIASPGLRVVGSGPPVLMLHAWMSSKTQWDPLMRRLESRFRCIAVDLHGYGDNPAAPQGEKFSLDDDIELIRTRLSELGVLNDALHIVAHSYGATVALRLAQRMPACVASLSLYEPVAFHVLDEGDPEAAGVARIAHRVTSLVEEGRGLQAAKLFIDHWSGPGSFERLSQLQRARSATQIAQAALGYRAVMGSPMRLAHCHAIHSPTLLLGGTRSVPGTGQILTRLAAAMPKARSGWIEAGHMAPAADPRLVNPMIEAFIELNAERVSQSLVAKAFRFFLRRLVSA